jgi:hypothetical protein
MTSSSEITKMMEEHYKAMALEPFYLGAKEELENPQPERPFCWRYTRAAFLFAWCVEECAFTAEIGGRDFVDAATIVKSKSVPAELLSSESVSFSASQLKQPFSDFLNRYVWGGWLKSYFADFDALFISESTIADELIDPSWENYQRMRELLNIRFNEWKKR